MSVTVLVPLRADGAWRDWAWAHLSRRWAALGWEVVTGSCPDGPWVKALAVEDALSRASGDVLVIADSDAWCPGVVAAVEAVEAGAPWAVPHTLVHRLTAGATDLVLEDGRFDGRTVEQRPYVGMIGGGCTVLRRDAYEACPLDPRFRGWGQEDAAWGVALTALYGPPWRSTEPLWHLWHPPMDRIGMTAGMASGECAPPRGTGSLAGRRLLAAYATAAEQGRMREFLAERGTEETREPTMWRYRNKGSGDIYEFQGENRRLSDLSGPDGNWDLIEKPAPRPLRDDDFRRTLALDENGSVGGPVSHRYTTADGAPMSGTVTVDLRPVETFSLPDPPAETAPADDSDLTARPPVRASVEEWRSYGRTGGIGDAVDGMTKQQIIDHFKS